MDRRTQTVRLFFVNFRYLCLEKQGLLCYNTLIKLDAYAMLSKYPLGEMYVLKST